MKFGQGDSLKQSIVFCILTLSLHWWSELWIWYWEFAEGNNCYIYFTYWVMHKYAHYIMLFIEPLEFHCQWSRYVAWADLIIWDHAASQWLIRRKIYKCIFSWKVHIMFTLRCVLCVVIFTSLPSKHLTWNFGIPWTL